MELLSLFISFKDKENNIIDTYTYRFDNSRDRDTPERHKIWQDRDNSELKILNAFFGSVGSDENLPNKLYASNTLLLIIDGEFNMTVETDIDVKNLENISTIEVQFEPFKK